MSVWFILVLLSIAKTSSIDVAPRWKCCDDGTILNDSLKCTKAPPEHSNNNTNNATILEAGDEYSNDTERIYKVCRKNGEAGKPFSGETDRNGNNGTCEDTLSNGTRVKLFCDGLTIVSVETPEKCDSLFTQLYYWGATMVVFATIIYNIPFIIVSIIYCSLPELRYRAYDKAVRNYNVCYMMINFLLIILGLYNLCHASLSVTAYRLFGLSIMFWTEGAVFWLFIICFDMTLVITRFRWAPKGGVDRGREERRKCMIYAAWGWGFATVITLMAAIVEFTPIFPSDSPLRPNFHKFDAINVAVIVWVITGPVLVCITITCLFIYTTVKTIAVQRSTAIIHENRKLSVKKRYFVFLKLYLLMDTPWFTSALAAIYHDLWILKFIKMIQPILIIVLIVPRKRLLAAIKCSKRNIDERVNIHLDRGNKDTHRTVKTIDPAVNGRIEQS